MMLMREEDWVPSLAELWGAILLVYWAMGGERQGEREREMGAFFFSFYFVFILKVSFTD